MKSMLITGAGGFIGSHLVDKALADGWEVWAAIRSTSSRQWLGDKRIHFVELDFEHRDTLCLQLKTLADQSGKWDVIINNMGVTKAYNPDLFQLVNCQYAIHFIEALRRNRMMPQQFIQMSSLSAWGPVHESDGGEITLSDPQRPNTAYGQSKANVARYLKQQNDVPYLIFYPTGVYGPRERDYFLMFKSVKMHLDFIAGLSPQMLTFVYVEDLVDCVFRAIEKGFCQKEYIVAENASYSSSEFRKMIQREFGYRYCLAIHVPLPILKAVSWGAEMLASLTGKTSTLNRDKYKIMAQRNWRADISAMVDELDFIPATPLKKGVRKTFAWYKSQGWL